MADRYDLVIVGMGSGGMVAAEFASTLDVKVAIVERDRVGGDCLWTGCVPSKALIASSKVAHRMRTAGAFGIEPVEPKVDSARVFERIRAVQRQIAETDDNAQRYRDMGVDVLFGSAWKVDQNDVTVPSSALASLIYQATGESSKMHGPGTSPPNGSKGGNRRGSRKSNMTPTVESSA